MSNEHINIPKDGKIKELSFSISLPAWVGPLKKITLVYNGIPVGIGTIKLVWVNPKTGQTTTDIYKIQKG